MASSSTHAIEVLEPEVRPIEEHGAERFPSPQPAPADTRWVIKVLTYIPT